MSDAAIVCSTKWYSVVVTSLMLTALFAECCLHQYFGFVSPKHNAFVNKLPPETSTVILGSSHVLHGLNPASLPPRCVQIALSGMNYSTMYSIVCKHVTADSNIKHLLVELDPVPIYFHTLEQHGPPGAFRGNISVYNYLTVQELAHHDLISFRQALSYALAERAMALRNPRIRPREVWGYLHSPKNEPFDYTKTFEALHAGMSRKSHKEHYKAQPGKLNAVAKYALWSHRPLVESNRESLFKIIKHCHKHMVSVVLFTVPHSPEYWFDADEEYKKYFDDIVTAVRSIPGVVVISPNGDWSASIGQLDMYDSDHLDPNGADKFAGQLLYRLRQAGLSIANDTALEVVE